MAYMIPNKPKYFDSQSREDFVFEKLSSLSDDYYIFHSFHMLHVKHEKNNKIYDGEIDFLLFHKDFGMLILEVKSGVPQIIEGEWYYQSGRKMPHGGPFNQAMRQKYMITDIFSQKDKYQDILKRLKVIHAIALPSVSKGQLLNIKFPMDSHKDLIITHDDLDDIDKKIQSIFTLDDKKTMINDYDAKVIINDILAPTYKVMGVKGFDLDIKQQRFLRLLEEQYVILDFLETQKFATINGVAGTGKTLIALEKARRFANEGERVLFLVYNRNLRDHLEQTYHHPNIEFITLDYLAKKHEIEGLTRYEGLSKYLEACYLEDKKFLYNHVLIDEGQDFGIEDVESLGILKNLWLNVEKKDGYMYIFYDKLQRVQGQKIPEIIESSECKMTLYKNCRNTYQIAKASLKPLDYEPKMFKGALEGVEPSTYQVSNPNQVIPKIFELVEMYFEQGYKDIVCLSVKSKEKSILQDYEEMKPIKVGKGTFKFSTSRKFKGLEADVVILVDIDEHTLFNDKLVYYVGSSRAKYSLAIIEVIF